MTKTQDAERIALDARVFVRKARREGHVNLIDADTLWSCAAALNMAGTDGWTVRKAARMTVNALTETDELSLIDWNDALFFPLRPSFARTDKGATRSVIRNLHREVSMYREAWEGINRDDMATFTRQAMAWLGDKSELRSSTLNGADWAAVYAHFVAEAEGV